MTISKTLAFSSYVEKLFFNVCAVGGIVNFEANTSVKKCMQKAYHSESNMCSYQDAAIFHTNTA